MVLREGCKSHDIVSPSMGCFTLSQAQGEGALTSITAIARWGQRRPGE